MGLELGKAIGNLSVYELYRVHVGRIKDIIKLTFLACLQAGQ
jgi:hypothetical protein